MDGGVGRHHGVVLLAGLGAQRQWRKGYGVARGAAHGDGEAVVAHDLETQAEAVFRHAVERAAVGMGDGLGGKQDVLEQLVDVALAREGGADLVELFKTTEEVLDGVHSAHFMQTARICFMSVMPCRTF